MPKHPTSRFDEPSPNDPRKPSPDPADACTEPLYEVRDFEILGATPASAEDDPAEWLHPELDAQEAALQELVSDIVQYDRGLTSILTSFATGDASKGELVRRVNAWSASMGGGQQRTSGAIPPEPWLH